MTDVLLPAMLNMLVILLTLVVFQCDISPISQEEALLPIP